MISVALIDFDTAALGLRTWDFGYAAWPWLDLENEEMCSLDEQARRLRLFVESYGPPADVRRVARTAVDRQKLLEIEEMRASKAEMAQGAAACLASTEALVELLDRA